jgi:hypothetical protein
MKGVIPFRLVPWASSAGTRDFCSALAALVGQGQNIFFSSPCTISAPLFSSPSKLVGQPCWVICLLVRFSGPYCNTHTPSVPVVNE